MLTCGSLMKSVLVAVILVVASGHPDEKLASCCKKVTKTEITEPILGYLVQKANPPCVQAVIFQTETALYCSQLNAPWVLRKIQELNRRARAQTTTSPVFSSSSASLLSIITSTISPPSSSTISPPSSSTISPPSSSTISPPSSSTISPPSSSTISSPSSSTISPPSSSTISSPSSSIMSSPSSFTASSPPPSSASTTDESFSGSGEE